MRRSIAAMLLSCACAHSRPAPMAVKPAPAKIVEVPPATIYQQARERMGRSEWPAAAERLSAYLAREPKDASAHFAAGYVAEQLRDGRAAQESYRRALALDPGHAGAALNLARLLHDRPGEAEPFLRAALEKHAGDPALTDALASAVLGAGKAEAAAALARGVLERHPKDAGAWRVLAAVEAGRGHMKLAVTALQNARKLAPDDAGIVNSLGLLAARRQDPEAARALFEEAARLGPSLPAPWSNLGALALRDRDYAAAEAAYGKAAALDGGAAGARLGHAWALEGLRRFKEARAEYEQVLALRPQDADALYGRAVAFKAEGNVPAALQAFRDYLAAGTAPRAKEAQSQIAALEARLKSAPPAPSPATAEAPATNGPAPAVTQ